MTSPQISHAPGWVTGIWIALMASMLVQIYFCFVVLLSCICGVIAASVLRYYVKKRKRREYDKAAVNADCDF